MDLEKVFELQLRAVHGRAVNDVAADGAVRDDEILVEGREPGLEARIRNLNAARDGHIPEELFVRHAGLEINLRDHRELDLDQRLIHFCHLEDGRRSKNVRGDLLAEERLSRAEHVLRRLARERNLVAARRLSLLLGHRALNRVSGFEVVENAFAGLHFERSVVLICLKERLRECGKIHRLAS